MSDVIAPFRGTGTIKRWKSCGFTTCTISTICRASEPYPGVGCIRRSFTVGSRTIRRDLATVGSRIPSPYAWSTGSNGFWRATIVLDPWSKAWRRRRSFFPVGSNNHLLGNHLFANGKALVFAGLFFQGPDAQSLLTIGQQIIERELREQILADGGHFERSPMYHAIILEDLLDLINITRAFARPVPEHWLELARRMLVWLAVMTHPDGEVSFFNDCAAGIAPSFADLATYGKRIGLDPVCLPEARVSTLGESGYIRVADREAIFLLDVAPVGPDYLPGHAHADTLSFEWSLYGHRLVVNSGTSCYGTSAERLRQRGTAAHSTVDVAGLDSSEVWGGFRVARRANPFQLVIEKFDHEVVVRCGHDGYRRLPGKPVHRRQWKFGQGRLEIRDQIEGRPLSATARYHLHPAIEARGEGQQGILSLPNNRQVCWRAEGGSAHLAESSYHPEFGVSIPSRCLELPFQNGMAIITFTWD